MSKFFIKVENIVVSVSLGKSIPLNKLVGKSENAEYDPEQFPGVIYRVSNPRAAALVFSSGKLICTGAKNVEEAKEAIKKVVIKIKDAGIIVPLKFDVNIENIVASSKIKAKLNLTELTFSMENAEYEPDQFPGVIYRIKKPRVTFLIFRTGKIICTGANKIKDVSIALEKLKEKLASIGIKAVPVKD